MGTHLLDSPAGNGSPVLQNWGAILDSLFGTCYCFPIIQGEKKGVHFGSLFSGPWGPIFGPNGGSQLNVVGIFTLGHAKLPECLARVALTEQEYPESRICIMHRT